MATKQIIPRKPVAVLLDDKKTLELIDRLERNEEVLLKGKPFIWHSDERLLYWQGRGPVKPKCSLEWKQAILTESHGDVEAGHFGIMKTLARLKEKYMWNGMIEEVSKFVKGCNTCQQVKHDSNHIPATPMPLEIANGRIETNQLDFITKLPLTEREKKTILTVIDQLTRYVVLVPIHTRW
jgi:hypothetical protein